MSASVLAGLTLLIIGESHMTLPQYLREPLNQALVAQGAQVHSVGACGASPARWLKATPVNCGADQVNTNTAVVQGQEAMTVPITDLIKKDKPDVIVVVIGDTIGSYGNPAFPKSWAWQEITSLTKAIASTQTKCVWVGPAWGSVGGEFSKDDVRTQLVSKFLEANVAPCTYIDSLTFSKPGEWKTLDGQHFTQAGYAAWSKSIASALEQSPTVKQIKK